MTSEDAAAADGLLWFGESFRLWGAKLTYGSISLIVVAVIVWYLLNRTAWGRHVHAIGDDPDSARLSGIRTNRTLISVYVLAGIICGFAAWVAIGRVGSVSPIAFDTVNLGSITAVVIGGTSLFGGRGSILGRSWGRSSSASSTPASRWPASTTTGRCSRPVPW